MFDYAIDLGGGYTTIYKRKAGFVLKEPTMVAVEKIKKNYVIKAIGTKAKEMIFKSPDSVEIFNPISNGVIENYDYAKIMLEYFLSKVEFKKGKQSAVFLSNCVHSKDERKLISRLFEDVGFIDVSFIPSVICTAIGCGRNISTSRAHLFVDIGATATEVAVLNQNSVMQGVSLGIGGKMMDIEIANSLAMNKRGDNFLVGLPTAEKIKNEVGSLYSNDTLNIEVLGTNLSNRLPSAKIVTSQDVHKVIRAGFEEIVRAVEVTINLLPPEIAQDIVNNTIIFSGGMANMTGLESFLEKNFKYPFTIAESPQDVNILGAGKLIEDITAIKTFKEFI